MTTPPPGAPGAFDRARRRALSLVAVTVATGSVSSAGAQGAEGFVDTRALFEAELGRRGIPFSIDAESGRHALQLQGGGSILVSLQNLERDVRDAREPGERVQRVARFVDAILSAAQHRPVTAETLYWCLEPNDHAEPPPLREPLSERLDKVLCSFDAAAGRITWLTPGDLESAHLAPAAARERATANVSRALAEAKLETTDIDGMRLAMLGSRLPFKAALILASNARAVLEAKVGWPLLAVVPQREFLFFWPEAHEGLTGRVGAVIVKEFESAPYPLSTEVFRLDDAGVSAIGAFPHGGTSG